MKSNWDGFSSVIASHVQDYLDHKRALARKFRNEEMTLRLLDRFLLDHQLDDITDITPTLIDSFLGSRPRHNPRSYNHLLSVIRGFFNWLVLHDHLDCSPVRARARRAVTRLQPFLFSVEQAKELLTLAASLPDRSRAPDRGVTYHLMFGLMYALGLRIGEVTRLRRCDVDPQQQLLRINRTKFSKDRLVPFGPRVGRRLADYLARPMTRVDTILPENPVFSFSVGRAVSPGTVSQTFHQLVANRFNVRPGVAPPRLHCLRHSFAVGTLLRWYRSGVDPGARLIHLSTFLGHVDPASTAWYLTITTELLDAANERFEQFAPSALALAESSP